MYSKMGRVWFWENAPLKIVFHNTFGKYIFSCSSCVTLMFMISFKTEQSSYLKIQEILDLKGNLLK